MDRRRRRSWRGAVRLSLGAFPLSLEVRADGSRLNENAPPYSDAWELTVVEESKHGPKRYAENVCRFVRGQQTLNGPWLLVTCPDVTGHASSEPENVPPVATSSEAKVVSVEQAFSAGYRAGVEAERSTQKRREQHAAAWRRRRANDSWDRRELVDVALLMRQAKHRGETPRNLVCDRMAYGSLKTADRRIAAAQYLLEHDMRFQLEVDCYRIEDTR